MATATRSPRSPQGSPWGADGIKSVIRKQFYPDEGEPRYSGYTIWRGVLPYKPFLSGANTIRAGWMPVGKIMGLPDLATTSTTRATS